MSDELTPEGELIDQYLLFPELLLPTIRTIWEMSLRLLQWSLYSVDPRFHLPNDRPNDLSSLQDLNDLRTFVRSVTVVVGKGVSLDYLIPNQGNDVKLWSHKFSTAHKAALWAGQRVVDAADGPKGEAPLGGKPIHAEQLRRIAEVSGPLGELSNLQAGLEIEASLYDRRKRMRAVATRRRLAAESAGAPAGTGNGKPKRKGQHPRSIRKKKAVVLFKAQRLKHGDKGAATIVNDKLGTDYSAETLARYARE